MIVINGKLYNVVTNPFTDRDTGVITQVSTAEILHTSRGKTELVALKLDPGVAESWKKAEGRDITVEVGFYAMKTREGGIQKGLMLADKRSLPSVHRVPAPAAA